MANINVSVTNTFDEWRIKTNELADAIGDVSLFPISIDGVQYNDLLSSVSEITQNANAITTIDTQIIAINTAINNAADGVAANVIDIQTNADDITAMDITVTSHTSLISAITNDVSSNNTNITSNTNDITYITGTVLPDMATVHSGDISDLQDAIVAVTIDVFNSSGTMVHP